MRKFCAVLILFLSLAGWLTEAHAEKLKVVATISIIGDVVRNVAGHAVDLTTLVGPDGDAHEYEPTPRDSVNLAHADIIFENGLYLEHWLDKLYKASGSKARRIIVSQGVKPRIFDDNPNEVDPHAWQDATNVILYAQNVRDALDRADPGHKGFYDANADAYIQKLKKLDAWVIQQVSAIAANKRKLVTNHDAFGYFARRYGFKIIGAVIPSATTEAADPSAKETADLLNIIKANGVHAVFSENISNPKLAGTIAKEAGAVVAPALYTDALGPPGSPGGTYVKMIKYNVEVFKKYLNG